LTSASTRLLMLIASAEPWFVKLSANNLNVDRPFY